MKILDFKRISRLCTFSAIAAIQIMVSVGCKPITSKDVSGSYSRQTNGLVDTIILSTNGAFQQIVSYTNGMRWSTTGQWVLKEQVIQLDQSYETFDFEHKSIKIPPELVALQTLWVEKHKLVRSEYEPIWIKK